MQATAYKLEIKFDTGDSANGGACDWVSGLLSEAGMWSDEHPLLDWAYDQCGGESVGPHEYEPGKWEATVWVLPYMGLTAEHLMLWVNRAFNLVGARIVESKEIDVPHPYREEDFLPEVFAVPIHTLDWVDRHSVNCIKCHELVDERECVPGPGGEGDICVKCQLEPEEI